MSDSEKRRTLSIPGGKREPKRVAPPGSARTEVNSRPSVLTGGFVASDIKGNSADWHGGPDRPKEAIPVQTYVASTNKIPEAPDTSMEIRSALTEAKVEQAGSVPEVAISKPEKSPEPQSTQEFIDAYYLGRVKVLSDSTVRRIKGSQVYPDPNVRSKLLSVAPSCDASLDRTRKLMFIASEVEDLKPLGEYLMRFAAEVVVRHPAVQANGMQAKLFPNYQDESTLEDAWAALCAVEPAVAPEGEAEFPGGRGQEREAGFAVISSFDRPTARKAKDRLPGAKGKPAPAIANKARRNALLCSVVWRVFRKQLSFSEAMRAMRNTVFKLAKLPDALESELLEAIALMPEKEDAKVALLLGWLVKQQEELNDRFSDAVRNTERLAAKVADLEKDREQAIETIARLEGELAQEQARKLELDAHIGVVTTHGQADFEALRAMSLGVVRDAVGRLEDVSTALGREPPKVSFAREVLDTIVDSLNAANKKLEES